MAAFCGLLPGCPHCVRSRARFPEAGWRKSFCVKRTAMISALSQTLFRKKRRDGQDPGSFDYIPYCYGLQRYGNLPLIEPLETRERQRWRNWSLPLTPPLLLRRNRAPFSGRMSGHPPGSDSFFPRMNVHLIQCDSMIQQHTVITCAKDWKRCSQNLTVSGRGGTDFTPVFTYVDKLCREGRLKHLGGFCILQTRRHLSVKAAGL